MESSSGPPSLIVLEVNSMCCRAYEKKLKEELWKLDGVCSVSVDLENDRVSVKGRLVDSNLLVKTIEKTGKYAEIIHFRRSSKSNAYEKSKPYRNETGKCSHDTGNRAPQNKNPCNNGHRFEKDEEEHKCEPYVPQEIDGRICRDFWCKQHKQRAIFHDKVPASAITGMFGHPFHNSGAPFHFSNNPWEHYGRHPGYNRRPPPPHGFGSGGYMPRFYDYGF
ncbi:uncharacterized protein [Primulina huaijiensis]|uniref:uncharacterized protein n=1 Tax=Primulina huaijiensis TaxID=1492673 RepID=UPI003CC77E4E